MNLTDTFEHAPKMTKAAWIQMRLDMTAKRPVDDGGPAYEEWYRAYCATDRLDPEPLKRLFRVEL